MKPDWSFCNFSATNFAGIPFLLGLIVPTKWVLSVKSFSANGIDVKKLSQVMVRAALRSERVKSKTI